MKQIFAARAHNTGGRVGRARAADGHPDLVMELPAELGGKPSGETEVTNPEELFALGYGACYLSALTFLARQQKISARAFAVDTVVTLNDPGEGTGLLDLGVELRGTLPGVEREKAVELMRAAHEMCPYSRATRGNIEVGLFVDGEPA